MSESNKKITVGDSASEKFNSCCKQVAEIADYGEALIKEAYEYHPERLMKIHKKVTDAENPDKGFNMTFGTIGTLAVLGAMFVADDMLAFVKGMTIGGFLLYAVFSESEQSKMKKELVKEVDDQVRYHLRAKHYGHEPG